MRPSTLLAVGAPLVLALPSPAPEPLPAPVPRPVPAATETNLITGLLTGLISGVLNVGSVLAAPAALLGDLNSVLAAAGPIESAIANGTLFGTDVPAIVQKFASAIQPTSTPTSIPDALAKASKAWGITSASQTPGTSQNLLANVGQLLLQGFSNADIQNLKQGFGNAVPTSSNQVLPASNFYTNPPTGNAKFTVSESDLRAAIYIPPEFTWGQKQPVIFSPGTGTVGYTNFQTNIGKLLSATSYADPVYLNIPNNLLGDAQVNAEYVAYTVQYFNTLTTKKVAVITWSQGALDAQWAYKYWPSTKNAVTDHIAISPDYHGTILAPILCPGFTTGSALTCTPSIAQQIYNSNFIAKLRSNGGDAALVPTTTVYSFTDEIVQPQAGTAASGFIQAGVGASNTFLQGACALQPAGFIYGHAGVLVNPVTYALVVDALTHDGPGQFSRVSASCRDVVAPGLGLGDVVSTLALIPEALLNILSYTPKVNEEPAVASYATR